MLKLKFVISQVLILKMISGFFTSNVSVFTNQILMFTLLSLIPKKKQVMGFKLKVFSLKKKDDLI